MAGEVVCSFFLSYGTVDSMALSSGATKSDSALTYGYLASSFWGTWDTSSLSSSATKSELVTVSGFSAVFVT